MSKHTNKHWLREKEYISLKLEDAAIFSRSSRNYLTSTREEEINRKFLYKFYNEYYGWYSTAPKHYRKKLNRIQRAKSKVILYKLINISDNFVFEDNYKDGPWYW